MNRAGALAPSPRSAPTVLLRSTHGFFTFRLFICFLHPRIHIEEIRFKSNSSLEKKQSRCRRASPSRAVNLNYKMFSQRKPGEERLTFSPHPGAWLQIHGGSEGTRWQQQSIHCCQLFPLWLRMVRYKLEATAQATGTTFRLDIQLLLPIKRQKRASNILSSKWSPAGTPNVLRQTKAEWFMLWKHSNNKHEWIGSFLWMEKRNPPFSNWGQQTDRKANEKSVWFCIKCINSVRIYEAACDTVTQRYAHKFKASSLKALAFERAVF